jgi:excisionase family DNA binding protein
MSEHTDHAAGMHGRERMLTAEHVAQRLSISVRTVWRLVDRKELPAPIRFNRKLVRWLEKDIDEWFEARRHGR